MHSDKIGIVDEKEVFWMGERPDGTGNNRMIMLTWTPDDAIKVAHDLINTAMMIKEGKDAPKPHSADHH